MDTRYNYVANSNIFRLPRYNNIFCKNKIFQFSIYRILIKWLYTFPKKTLLNRIPLHKKNSLENEVLHIPTRKIYPSNQPWGHYYATPPLFEKWRQILICLGEWVANMHDNAQKQKSIIITWRWEVTKIGWYLHTLL